jgi:hypothetical protein
LATLFEFRTCPFVLQPRLYFVYDISGFYSQAVADLLVKVTIGFILKQSATNWISDPPFMQYDTYGVKVELAAEIHPV